MTVNQQDDPWKAYYQKIEQRPPRELFKKLVQILEGEGHAPGFAIDLGCGDGAETLALLAAGWSVLAVDQSADAIQRVTAGARLAGSDRVQVQQARFEEASLPSADLVYAGVSLPFCPPEQFGGVWEKVRQALLPGGRFAGHFFGMRDSWSQKPDMSFFTAEQVQALVAGWQVELWQEVEDDQPSAFETMKHFHFFEIIARRP